MTAEVGEFSTTGLEAFISGPVSETVSGRLSLLKWDSDGYVDDRTTGKTGNATDIFAFRAQLALDPTDQWSVLLNIHGNSADNTGNPFVNQGRLQSDGVTPCSTSEILSFACFDGFGYRDADGGSDFFTGDYTDVPPIEVDTSGAYVQVEYAQGPWSLTSITAFEHTEKTVRGRFRRQPDTDHRRYQHRYGCRPVHTGATGQSYRGNDQLGCRCVFL